MLRRSTSGNEGRWGIYCRPERHRLLYSASVPLLPSAMAKMRWSFYSRLRSICGIGYPRSRRRRVHPLMGKPENSVQQAIEQICQTYSVPCFREQSRVVRIEGGRPVYFGKWRDALGVWHSCGKTDYLLTPKIHEIVLSPNQSVIIADGIAVPLWCEAKAGKERPAKPNRCMCGDTQLDHQDHFRKYVIESGAYHLVCRDSADELVKWFREHGVIN